MLDDWQVIALFQKVCMRMLSVFLVFLSTLNAAEKPNFIVILFDDLGATDIGCDGSTFYETPFIDQFLLDAHQVECERQCNLRALCEVHHQLADRHSRSNQIHFLFQPHR
jgi:hypothetical protein